MFTFPVGFMNPSGPPTNNLLAWYSLNEASGNRIDSHIGGHTLSQIGTVSSAVGKQGNSATFSGTQGNYLVSNSSIFVRGDTNLYIAAWIYPISITNNPFVLGRNTFNTNNRSYAIQIIASTGQPIFLVSGNGSTSSSTNSGSPALGSVALNSWNFLEAYHDAGGNQIGMALNGSAFTVQSHSTGLFGGTANFTIGQVNVEWPGTQAFNGRVDEVVLYSTLPSPELRAALYNSGAGISYS